MRYLKLLPSDDSASSILVGLNFESTVLEIEKVGLLRKDAGQNSDDSPRKKTSVCGGVAAVEERILLFGVTMQVAVDPNLPLFNFSELLHHTFDAEDLRMEVLVRVYPLSIQINP